MDEIWAIQFRMALYWRDHETDTEVTMDGARWQRPDDSPSPPAEPCGPHWFLTVGPILGPDEHGYYTIQGFGDHTIEIPESNVAAVYWRHVKEE